MRRFLPYLTLLIVCALVVIWYTHRPPPGASVFEDWQPTRVGRSWTITGSPGSESPTLVDANGAYQPTRDSYAIHFFLYDRDKHKLYSPLLGNVRVRRSLADNFPMPCLNWTADGLSLTENVSATSKECYAFVYLSSDARVKRQVSLYAAVLPYGVTGVMHRPARVRYVSNSNSTLGCHWVSHSIYVDGVPLLQCSLDPLDPATGAAALTERSDDITSYMHSGRFPSATSAADLRQVSSAAIRIDLALGTGLWKHILFTSPIGRPRPATYPKIIPPEFEQRWNQRLGPVRMHIPDRQIADCYYANVAYLTILTGNGLPMPGPTKYRSFWVRDCAYLCDALAAIGREDLVVPALKRLVSLQSADGGFPPKLGSAQQNELDAPGEAVHALVQRYRHTGDRKWLTSVWPCIRKASFYIRKTRGPDGIMPASFSAEDLGSGTQQHYWDDFWCIRGLRDGAFAARELGKTADAKWISAEAESLYEATMSSIRETTAKRGISYIPNGPQEWKSASAARGTSCGLWPCEVLDSKDPLVRKSFDAYWDKWIAPNGGGFVHRDHYWPYAGLDLAHCYLMLGQRERAIKILHWTVEHDPTGGWYSYPEGMSRKNLSLAEGDMPHGWFSASYILLVRSLFGSGRSGL